MLSLSVVSGMDLIRVAHNCASLSGSRIISPINCLFNWRGISSPRPPCTPSVCRNASTIAHAKKRNSYAQPATKRKQHVQFEEEEKEEDEEEFEYDKVVGEGEIEKEETNYYLDEGGYC